MVSIISTSSLFLLLGGGVVLGTPQKAKEVVKKDDGWTAKVNEQGQQVQELKMEAPMMTEEDQYGYNMPERYACDSCKAVVYHLNATFVRRHPKSRAMKEWEYTELFDEICANEFGGYGIKWIGGQNVLSGAALQMNEAELKPGSGMIQMGGESWTKRLGEICRKFVYDKIGEEELYTRFRANGELSDAMCWKETKDCALGPRTPTKEETEKKEKKAKKEKAKKEKEERAKKDEEKKKNMLDSRRGLENNEDIEKRRNDALEKKEKTGKRARKEASTTSLTGEKGATLDAMAFLEQLERKHGVSPRAYTKSRTSKEWEKLIVGAAGRIFQDFEEGGSSGSPDGGDDEEVISV